MSIHLEQNPELIQVPGVSISPRTLTLQVNFLNC